MTSPVPTAANMEPVLVASKKHVDARSTCIAQNLQTANSGKSYYCRVILCFCQIMSSLWAFCFCREYTLLCEEHHQEEILREKFQVPSRLMQKMSRSSKSKRNNKSGPSSQGCRQRRRSMPKRDNIGEFRFLHSIQNLDAFSASTRWLNGRRKEDEEETQEHSKRLRQKTVAKRHSKNQQQKPLNQTDVQGGKTVGLLTTNANDEALQGHFLAGFSGECLDLDEENPNLQRAKRRKIRKRDWIARQKLNKVEVRWRSCEKVGKFENSTSSGILPSSQDPLLMAGGLKEHVRALKESVLLPLIYPDLFETLHIQPPAGMLLHGPATFLE